MICGHCGARMSDDVSAFRRHHLDGCDRLARFLSALRSGMSSSRAAVEAGYRERVPMSEEVKATLRALAEEKRRRKRLGG